MFWGEAWDCQQSHRTLFFREARKWRAPDPITRSTNFWSRWAEKSDNYLRLLPFLPGNIHILEEYKQKMKRYKSRVLAFHWRGARSQWDALGTWRLAGITRDKSVCDELCQKPSNWHLNKVVELFWKGRDEDCNWTEEPCHLLSGPVHLMNFSKEWSRQLIKSWNNGETRNQNRWMLDLVSCKYFTQQNINFCRFGQL